MPRSLSPLLLVALAATASAQTEIWVDPVLGNDANPGTFALPLLRLTQAVQNAGPGDRIHLLPGLYGAANGESLPIALGVIPQQNLVVRGIGGAVFDLGQSTLPLFRLINGADGCRITNLTITNSDRSNWWTRVINSGSGVDAGDAANNVEIDRCRFVNVNRGFVLWTVDNVQGWRIHDNLFHDCTNDAILEYTGNNEVYNNTFVTGTWKAYISDSATSRFYNNVIANYNIAFECNNTANAITRYQNNWIWQTGVLKQGAGLLGALPSSNVVGIDPQFVDPVNGDFHLQSGSPLIDAGTAAIFARGDLDNVSRIVDSDLDGSLLPDIGAFESSPLQLSVTLDPLTQIMTVTPGSPLPNVFTFTLFSFDEGLVSIPGLPPILLDQGTFIPTILGAPLPTSWVLPLLAVPPFPPGTRLVIQTLGVVPQLNTFLPSNQVWTQV